MRVHQYQPENVSQGKHAVPSTFFDDPDLKQDLEEVESELEKIVLDAGGPLKSMLLHVLHSGGKRIRPTLVLKCGRCLQEKENYDLIITAAAFELIHMASLIHDDIIDQSEVRHKVPTLNSLWGIHYSTLAGDFVFAKAFELLVSARLTECLSLMIQSIKQMCDGEIRQQDQRFISDTSLADYYERIQKKTGCLITNCCKAGAVISSANPLHRDCILGYGTHIGFAFQIIDDILDFTGNAKETGKPVGMDLFQGNVTLPVILLNRDGAYTSFLESLMESEKSYMAHFPKLVQLLYETGAMDEAFRTAKDHISKAKSCLQMLPAGRHRDFLDGLADIIVERTH